MEYKKEYYESVKHRNYKASMELEKQNEELEDYVLQLELAYRTMRGNLQNIQQSVYEINNTINHMLDVFPLDPKKLKH